MPFYIDSSAFTKLVVAEPESPAMLRWARGQAVKLVSSDLLRTEALRAARRHVPDPSAEVRELLNGITLIALSRELCESAAALDPVLLRALDALHLAAAMSFDELEGLATYDERLASAARGYGIAVVAPR